jgi:hypothetical protein
VTNQQPSIGRIVHYVSYGTPGGEFGQQCRAAVVTQVHGRDDLDDTWRVGLCVLNPTGQFFNESVRQSEQWHDGGTWHWPERTDGQ